MLRTKTLGICASVLFFAACGSSKNNTTGGTGGGGTMGTSTGASTSAGTSSGTGGTTTSTSGTTSSGTTSSGTTSSGTTSSGTTSSTSSTSSGATMCTGPGYIFNGGSLFQATEPWNTAVDQDPVSSQSATIIGWLASNGGWGNNNTFQIDLSMNVLCADASTPLKPFQNTATNNDPSFCGPDCDVGHTSFPVPPNGAVEGEAGYACNGGGDCHMLVVDLSRNWLWEMYGAYNPADPNNFYSVGGATIWDLGHAYSPSLRGDGCTSSDAGGFPVAAMLFSADEIKAGHIDHAIRFILPNARIRAGTYVHPGTHTTGATSGGSNAPPYGVRFRLRAGFPLASLPSDGARVVATAMQKYGLFLADGGNIALTAADDRFTQHKWTDVSVDSQSLASIQVSDMEVVDMGTPMTATDCVRNP
jgi:hypothetical protein